MSSENTYPLFKVQLSARVKHVPNILSHCCLSETPLPVPLSSPPLPLRTRQFEGYTEINSMVRISLKNRFLRYDLITDHSLSNNFHCCRNQHCVTQTFDINQDEFKSTHVWIQPSPLFYSQLVWISAVNSSYVAQLSRYSHKRKVIAQTKARTTMTSLMTF